jgi:hypothetical protein
MVLTSPATLSVSAPQFADQVVGALATVSLSTAIAHLVELRCLSNILNNGAELNVMRAEELQTITSSLGAM